MHTTCLQHIILTVSDFQKIVSMIHEFLLKLNEDVECSQLRDAFNYTLLQLHRFYRILHAQTQNDPDSGTARTLNRTVSPTTPRSDLSDDKFTWKWVELDSSNSVRSTLPLKSSLKSRLPVILRSTKQGNNGFIAQLLEQGLNEHLVFSTPVLVNDVIAFTDFVVISCLGLFIHCSFTTSDSNSGIEFSGIWD